jgi:Family of unknown function (DUF6157)
MTTTNYYNTFIEIAEDCPISAAEIPPMKGENLSVANLQFDMIMANPYKYTSDEVLFTIYAQRNGIVSNLEEERAAFFAKGQACLRASPLTKRYGWGTHHDTEGKVALYPAESVEYQQFVSDAALKHTKGMRSKRV